MLVKIIPVTSSRSRLKLTLWEELKMLFFFFLEMIFLVCEIANLLSEGCGCRGWENRNTKNRSLISLIKFHSVYLIFKELKFLHIVFARKVIHERFSDLMGNILFSKWKNKFSVNSLERSSNWGSQFFPQSTWSVPINNKALRGKMIP